MLSTSNSLTVPFQISVVYLLSYLIVLECFVTVFTYKNIIAFRKKINSCHIAGNYSLRIYYVSGNCKPTGIRV